MSNNDDKGSPKKQLMKITNSGNLTKDEKFNAFDIIGIIVGLVGGLILPFGGFLTPIIGAVAGYFLTPYFVPQSMKWLRDFMNKDK